MVDSKTVDEFISKIPQIKTGMFPDFLSKTRDIFEARLQTFISKNRNWLLGAVIGEIGANTFDHNFSFNSDLPRGFFCDFMTSPSCIFMCDFGAGLKSTLSRVVDGIHTDKDAIEIAFTKPISGRAPELRGNGLKFVLSSVVQNGWNLHFQSGGAVCKADEDGYYFDDSDFVHNGILCVLSCRTD